MKLDSGSVTIEKPIKEVFSFVSKLENLEKQIPEEYLKDYRIEVDEDLSGTFTLGETIAFYLFAIYEGDDDKFFELEVVEILENKRIAFDLVRMSKYDEEKDDWESLPSIKDLLGVMRLEMLFEPVDNTTKISITSEFQMKSNIVSLFLRVFNFIDRISNRKYYKKWAELIEKYA